MIKCKCKGDNMESLGEKIKNIRISNNLKQSELADILHISEKTICSSSSILNFLHKFLIINPVLIIKIYLLPSAYLIYYFSKYKFTYYT